MTNNVDPDQTAPIGAVCSGSTLFVSLLNSPLMLGNYLHQTTSANEIFRCIFLGALRVNPYHNVVCLLRLFHVFKCTQESFDHGSKHHES